MCAKMLLYNFSLFSAIVTWIGVLAEEEVSSPLRVAQCRATCLQKVRNSLLLILGMHLSHYSYHFSTLILIPCIILVNLVNLSPSYDHQS